MLAPASSSRSRTTIESILDWNTKEGMIFRGGSGSGINLSQHPRLEGAPVQGRAGVRARVASCAAPTPGPARSSRAARRAARPRWSCSTSTTRTSSTSSGARRARRRRPPRCATPASTCASTPTRFASIQYQNANNSVRVTDEFMERAERGEEWELTARDGRRAWSSASTRASCSARSPTPPGAAPTRACSTTRRSTSGTRARTRGGSTRLTRASRATLGSTRPWASSRFEDLVRRAARQARTSASTRIAPRRRRPAPAWSPRVRSP